MQLHKPPWPVTMNAVTIQLRNNKREESQFDNSQLILPHIKSIELFEVPLS